MKRSDSCKFDCLFLVNHFTANSKDSLDYK